MERTYNRRGLPEKELYQIMLKEIEKDEVLSWGKYIHVLIVTDRCRGRAQGLQEYLSAKTDLAQVRLLDTAEDIKNYKFENGVIPDLVIYVGLQDNDANYNLIKKIKEANTWVINVMYMFIDDLPYDYRHDGFSQIFDCDRPTKEFSIFLQKILWYQFHLVYTINFDLRKANDNLRAQLKAEKKLTILSRLKRWLKEKI